MSDYYEDNYQSYHEKTFLIDPSSFLEPFVSRLPEGSLVLDVGCGSGRDLLWLKRRGFNVIGFERSKGLAALARKNAGCEVVEGDFEIYDFSKISTDAILLLGALVHVSHERLPDVFKNITQALKCRNDPLLSVTRYQPRAYLYVSLKEGNEIWNDGQGRTFYLWQDEKLRELFSKQGFSVLDFSRSESAVRTGDTWLGYVLEDKRVG